MWRAREIVGHMGKIPCFTNLSIWVRITNIHAKKLEVASRMPVAQDLEDGIEIGGGGISRVC